MLRSTDKKMTSNISNSIFLYETTDRVAFMKYTKSACGEDSLLNTAESNEKPETYRKHFSGNMTFRSFVPTPLSEILRNTTIWYKREHNRWYRRLDAFLFACVRKCIETNAEKLKKTTSLKIDFLTRLIYVKLYPKRYNLLRLVVFYIRNDVISKFISNFASERI